MWHDWWMAHRAELWVSVFVTIPVLLVVAGVAWAIGWWTARKDRKK